MKTVLMSAASVCVAAGLAASVALAQPRGNDAALARIEAKWSGVMTTIRGWNEDSFRQFREGYRDYPADVLERALAAPSFEKMMEALDGHAALRSQEAMAKAFPRVHSMSETRPEDAANPQLVEARQLVAKSLGDDARDLVFIPITPCTVWDTRFATNPDSAGAIANATTKKFYSHLDGAGGSYAAYGGNPSCPETAQNAIGLRPFAVMMTVYVNEAQNNGWLTFYRDGDADPSLATISVYYSAGPTRTQTVISKSSRGYGSGAYDVAVTSRFATTHASAAITGYFVKVTDAGTVTSVATGAGLTGGPITTSGTIGLAATNLLPTIACGATQIARWNGAAWTCSMDIDTNSGGTVTAVTASAPLASSGGTTPQISLSGSIPVASGGTGATSLANNGVLVGQGTGAISATAAGATGQVLIGTTGAAPSWSGSLSLSGNLLLPYDSTATSGTIRKGAFPFLHAFGLGNTFVGLESGNFTMTGEQNTGAGFATLLDNTTGTGNVALGNNALQFNTTGYYNTASGGTALYVNTTGFQNTATGALALLNNSTGFQNTAGGTAAMLSNTVGGFNTAYGMGALSNNTSGASNIALGYNAGASLTTGDANIAIGHGGVAGESSTIRLGTGQTRAFVAGIHGVTPAGSAIPVYIDSSGQLGTVGASSSGTVTSVATGAGLTGGPITTSGTIGLATTNLLPTVACSPTQIPRWSGSAWACSNDIDTNSGGTVTSVGASSPLASSGGTTPSISLTGTVPVANGGTGLASLTTNGILFGQGTSAIGSTVGTTGQLLMGTGSVPIWTDSPSIAGNFTLPNSTATTGNIRKGVNSFIHNYGTNNTFVGVGAGNFTLTGSNNTAMGTQALPNVTTGFQNTAMGLQVLFSNTSGLDNTAVGLQTLYNNTTGNYNTAFGMSALSGNTTGSNNIALGLSAGIFLTTGDNNIAIDHPGVAGESNTTRLGLGQTRVFIAGIRGITTGNNNAIPVLIDSAGQLGTVSSSRRAKYDIADMASASGALMKLRPVTFQYRQHGPGGSRQFGLIAEEVAEVYPDLVAHSADGSIETVMYHFLPTMLLNEFQKQQRTIEAQAREAMQYRARIARLEQAAAEVADLRRQVSELVRVVEQQRGGSAAMAVLAPR